MAQSYPVSYWHIINDTIAFNDSVTGLLPKQTVTKYKDTDPIEFYKRFVFPKITKIKTFNVDQINTQLARFVIIYSFQQDELLTNTNFSYSDINNKLYKFKLPHNKDVYIFPVSKDNILTVNGNAATTLIHKGIPTPILNIDTTVQSESCDEEVSSGEDTSGEEEEEELGEEEDEELGEEEEEELGEEEEEELEEEAEEELEEELEEEEEEELEEEEDTEDGGRPGRKKKAIKKLPTELPTRGRKKTKPESVFNISQMLKHDSWPDIDDKRAISHLLSTPYAIKYRQEVIKLLIQFCKLPIIDCYKIELSIYNYAITQAEKYYIYAHWENPEFIPYYIDKAKSLICNLCAEFGVNNTRLRNIVNEHKVDLLTLANMTYQELWPENWQAIKDEQLKLEQIRKDAIKAKATDIFKCPRCAKRNSIYFELQTRSSDEPMTQFITCQECGLHWKQG
jgi:DNA-directed RNA polymerase subunit M/transcription elongation factor TFIIS